MWRYVAIGLEYFAFQLTNHRRVDDEEIDKRCDELREKLLAQAESGRNKGAATKRSFKEHQVHEMADAKIKESERLRRALKISSDYEEGSHWKRQEERLRTALAREEGEVEDDKEHARKPRDGKE